MKKFLRIAAALMAVFAMTNFIACSSGSDSDDSGTGGTETGGGNGGSGTGGTETGGGNGGSETGGTETGGNTGNENGGDTGGSSGNTGDSFENTCWVLDDEVWYTDGNCTITVSANSYVHIKDGSNGDVYFSNGVSNAVTELLKAPAAAGSKTVTLEKGYSFTYVIEGTTVKFTFATEQGTGTKEAVLNEDKTSFTITETEIVDGEEETITMTYKKVASAPANATVTLTLKTTGETPVEPTEPETPAEPVTYSFESGISAEDVNSVGLVYATAKKVYNTPVAAELTEKVLTSGATIGWKSSKAGTLRFRAASEDPAGVTALNYNGGSADDISASCGTPDRYVKVPVKAGQTITVTYKVVASSSLTEEALGQIGLFDDSNAAVGTVTADLKLKSDDGSKKTLTATAAADGNVKVVFSRNGATGGGVDIYSIVVE